MEKQNRYLIILKKQLRNMKAFIKKDIVRHLKNKIIFFSLTTVLYMLNFECNAQNNNKTYIYNSVESHIFIGDSVEYNMLSEKVFGVNLLPYALIMASCYNYGLACYDVYTIIIEEMLDRNNLPIDSFLVETAINYLIKGADMNNWNCCTELSYLYKEGLFVEKSEEKSLLYLEKARKNKRDVFIELDEPESKK